MAWSLIANVKYSAGTSSGGTTGSINTTGANVIVAVVSNVNNIGNFSDNKSNTYFRINGSSVNDAQRMCAYWICFNPTVGSGHTFTVGGATVFPTCYVTAWSGGTNLAGVPGTFTVNSVNSLQAGSQTPQLSNCLLIAALSYRDTTSVSINGGFTITDQAPFIAATAIGGALAYLIQTTAAAANPTWSWTNSVNAAAGLLMIAAADSSGGGGSSAGGVYGAA